MIGMRRARLAAVSALVAAVPVVCSCSASGGSGACSAAVKRQVQTTITSVEARAGVHSFGAIGPTCNGIGPKGLIAQRTYPFVEGRQRTIESALSANGWVSTPDSGVDDYMAQLTASRLTTHVELVTAHNDEGRFTVVATFTTTGTPG
jgi:hypothetical protein